MLLVQQVVKYVTYQVLPKEKCSMKLEHQEESIIFELLWARIDQMARMGGRKGSLQIYY